MSRLLDKPGHNVRGALDIEDIFLNIPCSDDLPKSISLGNRHSLLLLQQHKV
uniref:Uncharacterized protein n=1 Tax=Candidatus Kentrum sp. SD TaxID=2126332 RepID=A0A450ZAN9_9GAMM|nr:MAG: hypothetical protein BECKSD772E_GA0070983_14631 [Candidatus Kentron sp. SD]